MILHDVNVWVYAFRSDSPQHLLARTEIEHSISGGEQFLFCPVIAASFLRIVTNSRIFINPSTTNEAWLFIETLQDHPAAVYTEIDAMTFGIFKHISLIGQETGNCIPDALLAALAIRHEALFVTTDYGFKRYQGLKVHFMQEK
ncbi:TA system VapC family ribonuclease toxin [Spirochaeta dissipatitropha]